MKAYVTIIEEPNGKWGWEFKTESVSGEHLAGGGEKTADNKKEAEQQAMGFAKVLLETEKISHETHTVVLQEGIRK